MKRQGVRSVKKYLKNIPKDQRLLGKYVRRVVLDGNGRMANEKPLIENVLAEY